MPPNDVPAKPGETRSSHTDFRDPLIFSELKAFVEAQGRDFRSLSSKEEADQFQHFVTYHVVRRWFLPDLTLEDARLAIVDGSDDNQTDSIALIVNDDLIDSADTLESTLDDQAGLCIRLVLIQVTRQCKFEQDKMSSFVDGSQHFLADRARLLENSQVAAVRALKDHLFRIAKERDCASVEIHLYYCTLGRWSDSDRQQKWRDWSYDKIRHQSPASTEVELETVDFPRLREYLAQNRLRRRAAAPEEPYSKTVVAPRLVEFEKMDPASAWLGYLDAAEYVKLLEREDGQGMEERVFADNVRGFNGTTNPVNRGIAETLRGPDSRHFVLLNNGVTLIAPVVEYRDGQLTLTNYQIVNGLQTSYLLYRYRRRSTLKDVAVPIKVVRTTDPALADAIVVGTNSQTVIDKVQFLSREPLLRQLVALLEQRGRENPDGRLWLERRSGEFGDNPEIGDNSRIIKLEELIRGAACVLLGQPHLAERGLSGVLPLIPENLFREDHRVEPYYATAVVFHTVRAFLEQTPAARDLLPYEYHLLHLLRLAVEPGTVPENLLSSDEGDCYWQAVAGQLREGDHARQSLEKACQVLREIRSRLPRGGHRRKNAPTTARTTEESAKRMKRR